MKKENSKIIIYNTEGGDTKIEVKLDNETVWLSQDQIAELFDKGRSTITEHINNVIKEGELVENSVSRVSRRTGTDGKEYQVKFFNLDMIISVGYRVNSTRATQFRIWATQKLREYIIKGFVMDDERLAEGGVKKTYFKEWEEFRNKLDYVFNRISTPKVKQIAKKWYDEVLEELGWEEYSLNRL